MASGTGRMNNRQGTLTAFMSVKKQGINLDSDGLKSSGKPARTPVRANKKQKLTEADGQMNEVKSLFGSPAVTRSTLTSKTSPLPASFYPTTEPARANERLQKCLIKNKLKAPPLSSDSNVVDTSCLVTCQGATTLPVESAVKIQQSPCTSGKKKLIGGDTVEKAEKEIPPPLLTKEKSSCTTESTASAKSLHASDRYRHLVRKRTAPPILSDDEDLHVPPPPVPKPLSAVCPTTFKSTVEGIKPVPGYIKYRHLVKPGTKLALPDKYDILERIFAAIEQTLVFNQGQGQNSVFVKIKKPVENMCNRSFELSHLAQIVHIFPEAYHLQSVRYLHQGEYLNTISININYNALESDGLKPAENGITESTGTAYRQVTFVSSQMEKRRRVLHDRLLGLIQAKHNDFLAEINFSIEPGKVLRQWHPKFDPDSAPDVPQATLPKVELYRRGNNHMLSKRGTSAIQGKKIEGQARTPLTTDGAGKIETPPVIDTGTMSLESRCNSVSGVDFGQSTLNETKSSSASASSAGRGSETSRSKILPTTPTPPAAKSKAGSLLERIRAKENRRIQDTMFGQTIEQIHRKALLSRLPQMADSISFFFISNKKNVMHLRDVLNILADSLRLPLSETEMMEHINLLCDIAPTWIKITTLDTHYTTGGGPKLVHLDRTAITVKEVKEECKKELQRILDCRVT